MRFHSGGLPTNCVSILRKCVRITFSRRLYPVLFTYNLFDDTQDRANDIQDLRQILDTKPDFHILVVETCKATNIANNMFYKADFIPIQ